LIITQKIGLLSMGFRMFKLSICSEKATAVPKVMMISNNFWLAGIVSVCSVVSCSLV
jgi:hypothetical protein